jgi:succinoglycan biosynthesis protein ExoM
VGVRCMTRRGCASSHCCTARCLRVARLFTTGCTCRCLGLLRSIRRRNVSHSSCRCQSWQIEILVLPYCRIDQSGAVFLAWSTGLPVVATGAPWLAGYAVLAGVCVIPPADHLAFAATAVRVAAYAAIRFWLGRAVHRWSKLLRAGRKFGESLNKESKLINVETGVFQGERTLLSICICTFRRPVDLNRAIRSVQALVLPVDLDVELVVVDNDPAKSAQTVAERAGQTGPIPMRYFVEPRAGVSFARNRCVDEARGEWIAFFDDDEYVDRKWLAGLWHTARAHGAAAVFGPVIAEFALPPPAWLLAVGSHPVPSYPTGTTMDYRECRTGNVLFHRHLHYALGGFDARFASSGAEDTDFFWRAIKSGARLVWCDSALVYEIVPAERMSRRWRLRRAFKLGRNFTRLQAVHVGRRAYAVGFLRGVAALLIFAPPALILRLAGHKLWFACECKVAAGLGKIFAALGEGRGDYALASARKNVGISQRG